MKFVMHTQCAAVAMAVDVLTRNHKPTVLNRFQYTSFIVN